MQADGGATEHVEAAQGHSELRYDAKDLVTLLGISGPDAAHIQEPLVPLIEVGYGGEFWWQVPFEKSQEMLELMRRGQNAGYHYDWGDARDGSYRPEGERTSINRYEVDWASMTQTNVDNDRKRSIRIVYVRGQDLTARDTGYLPRNA